MDGTDDMMRAAERLSAVTVRNAKAPGMYPDGKGLYLRIGPSGSRSWIYRYRVGERRHDMGLGPYPEISLADARERALQARKLRVDRIDPIAERRATRAPQPAMMTFRECAAQYIDGHRPGWRDHREAAQWEASLRDHVHPIIGSLLVAAIDTGRVMQALQSIWATKPETAGRVRRRIEAILGYATTCGYRQGENPARWRGHLQNLLPKRSKVRRTEQHPALPYAEMGAFMADLRQQESIAARALEFTILTAARRGEVVGGSWGEIDLGDKVWAIPANRMKAGKEHRVPLCDRAVEILGTAGNGPLFQIGDKAMLRLLTSMGRSDLTTHGFRSTFATWAAERTNYPFEVREICLAHSVGDAVTRAYQRTDLFDRRRRLMQDWASYCGQPATGGDVVPIRA